MPTRHALLVEDYVPLRTLVGEALERAGFQVRSCGSAAEALAAFSPGDADVLITDIDLQDRPNGVELATIMRAQDPGLAIVFLTNYPAGTAFAGKVAPPERHAFLQKSLMDSGDRLLEAVESALADAEAPLQLSDDENPFDRLTAGQLDVVRLIAAGLTNAEIASRRGTNQRAVERMIYRLFTQLGITNDPAHNPRVLVANRYTQAFGYPVLEEQP